MKVRIMHLIGGVGSGGAERQLFQLSSALTRRGWQQTVVSFDEGGGWAKPLKDAGVNVYEVPRNVFKLRRLGLLYSIVKKETPSIIVSWSPHVAVYSECLCCVGPVKRIVNVRNDLTVDTNSGAVAKNQSWYFWAIKNADSIISNSDMGINVLKSRDIKLRRSKVIRNIAWSCGRSRETVPQSPLRIAAVGTLKRLKGYHVLFEALGQLATEGKQFILYLAGTGPEKQNLERLAASLGISEQVHFLGFVENVPQLLSKSHLLVHPSFSESFSNTIMEAMSCGLPVIASAAGGNREIVREGETGFLVPPGHPDLLAVAIREFMDAPNLLLNFGLAGLDVIRQMCDETEVVSQYEEEFNRLVSDLSGGNN